MEKAVAPTFVDRTEIKAFLVPTFWSAKFTPMRRGYAHREIHIGSPMPELPNQEAAKTLRGPHAVSRADPLAPGLFHLE